MDFINEKEDLSIMIKVNLNKIDDIKKFSNVVNSFVSDIDVVSGNIVIDAKSIMALYTLDLSKDIYVRIISDNVAECRKFDAAMEEFR